MSLHLPIKADSISTFSTLIASNSLPTAVVDVFGSPRQVPILPYQHSSKWNATVNRQNKPFTIRFNTEGMPDGCGVKCGDFALRSTAIMTAMVVDGGRPVSFPNSIKKVQLRIVWPGYESVDFSVPIDVRAITVCQLAGKVASSYQDFFKVASQQRCMSPEWALTPTLFDTLRILGIRNTYDNLYQAEVVVG